MSSHTPARVSAGVPDGGQFAHQHKPEAGVFLAAPAQAGVDMTVARQLATTAPQRRYAEAIASTDGLRYDRSSAGAVHGYVGKLRDAGYRVTTERDGDSQRFVYRVTDFDERYATIYTQARVTGPCACQDLTTVADEYHYPRCLTDLSADQLDEFTDLQYERGLYADRHELVAEVTDGH